MDVHFPIAFLGLLICLMNICWVNEGTPSNELHRKGGKKSFIIRNEYSALQNSSLHPRRREKHSNNWAELLPDQGLQLPRAVPVTFYSKLRRKWTVFFFQRGFLYAINKTRCFGENEEWNRPDPNSHGILQTVEGRRCWQVKVKATQSCPTLCNPLDCTVYGILQARILEWGAFPFSRGSAQPRDWTQVSSIAGGLFTSWATREAQEYWSG